MRCPECGFLRMRHVSYTNCIKQDKKWYKEKRIHIGYWCPDCYKFYYLDEDDYFFMELKPIHDKLLMIRNSMMAQLHEILEVDMKHSLWEKISKLSSTVDNDLWNAINDLYHEM